MDVTYTLVTKDQNETELDKARRDYIARSGLGMASAGSAKRLYVQMTAAYGKGEVSDSQYEADLDLISRGVCSGQSKPDQKALAELREKINEENEAFRIKRDMQKARENPTFETLHPTAGALYRFTKNGKNVTEEARELLATYKNVVSHLDENDPMRKLHDRITTHDYAPLFANVKAPGEKGPEIA